MKYRTGASRQPQLHSKHSQLLGWTAPLKTGDVNHGAPKSQLVGVRREVVHLL